MTRGNANRTEMKTWPAQSRRKNNETHSIFTFNPFFIDFIFENIINLLKNIFDQRKKTQRKTTEKKDENHSLLKARIFFGIWHIFSKHSQWIFDRKTQAATIGLDVKKFQFKISQQKRQQHTQCRFDVIKQTTTQWETHRYTSSRESCYSKHT